MRRPASYSSRGPLLCRLVAAEVMTPPISGFLVTADSARAFGRASPSQGGPRPALLQPLKVTVTWICTSRFGAWPGSAEAGAFRRRPGSNLVYPLTMAALEGVHPWRRRMYRRGEDGLGRRRRAPDAGGEPGSVRRGPRPALRITRGFLLAARQCGRVVLLEEGKQAFPDFAAQRRDGITIYGSRHGDQFYRRAGRVFNEYVTAAPVAV